MPNRQFVDEILTFEIRDSTVFVDAAGLEFATPLRKFRASMARAAKVLAEYEARGDVIQMPKRGGRKRGQH